MKFRSVIACAHRLCDRNSVFAICVILEGRPLFLQMLQTPSVLRALVVGCGLQIIQQLAGINTVM